MMIVAYLREDVSVQQHQHQYQPQQQQHQQTTETTKAENDALSSNYNATTASLPPDVVLQCRKIETPTKAFFDEFIACFSVRKNMRMLISVQKPSNAVPIIDGLK